MAVTEFVAAVVAMVVLVTVIVRMTLRIGVTVIVRMRAHRFTMTWSAYKYTHLLGNCAALATASVRHLTVR